MDAVVMTDIHRGGRITACHVTDVKAMEEYKLVRHRYGLSESALQDLNTRRLLQSNFRARTARFSTPRTYRVRVEIPHFEMPSQ